MNPINFDLTVKTQPVTIGGETYEIREMSGKARDLYQDDMQGRIRYDEKGNAISFTKQEGMRALLINLCLFDKDGKQIPIQTIQSWPSKVIDGLFAECSKINALNKTPAESEAAAKND